LNGEILGYVNKVDTAEHVASKQNVSGNWVFVKTSNSYEGWISKDFVKEQIVSKNID